MLLIEHRKANRNDIMHTNPTHPHYFRHLGSYFALFVDPPATLNSVELIKKFVEVSWFIHAIWKFEKYETEQNLSTYEEDLLLRYQLSKQYIK